MCSGVSRKKLIEVALPLEAINMESAREKSIRHGHPSTLHLWWARRPLAACRAVLWASLVDDPSSWPDRFPTEEDQKRERERLFDILGRITIETDKKGNQKQVVRGLVSWNDINDPRSQVLEAGQREIARCLAWELGEEPPTKPDAVREYIATHAPPAYDPFAGGGSIPLEAQRLGLEAHASDLNPVAVLINKALIEIPPKFKDQPPVNPEDRKQIRTWKGAQGLAADLRYYGRWVRDEALKQIGHLYPKIELPCKYGSKEAQVLAWLWARTVHCPNPACRAITPLVRSFKLATKKGKEAYIQPTIDRSSHPPTVYFHSVEGVGIVPEGTIRRSGATCICCESPIAFDYIRDQGKAGCLGKQLMTIVAEGDRRRIYLSPNEEHELAEHSAEPAWIPNSDLPEQALGFRVQLYGIEKHADLFTKRQLTALETFGNLSNLARNKILSDALNTGLSEGKRLTDEGREAKAYSDALAMYLALSASKSADNNSTLCLWMSGTKYEVVQHVFSRQTLSMTWDYAESNPFAGSSGDYYQQVDRAANVFEICIPTITMSPGTAYQNDAVLESKVLNAVISTDPPYYDAVSYADLSDYFYVWLRHSLKEIFPDIFKTVLVPKDKELIAEPFRHKGKEKAQHFFENGLKNAFTQIHDSTTAACPFTVYYAFKQAEEDGGSQGKGLIASTGWETMLEGLIQANFSITGTWPVRTERSARTRSNNSNALASSIVLVCRPRPSEALKITRRQFLSELKSQLPKALRTLQQGNIAPVDLAQASIGPGMAVFSQYAAVLENDGFPMRIRTALQLINQVLDEFLADQEGEFDGDTRWALTWFEQYQFGKGDYGDAETLSKAKNTSVKGLEVAGILEARSGKVRLLKRSELEGDWKPESDDRMPDWEVTQHLIHELDQKGEMGAAALLAKLGDLAERARDLAYRLYNLCDRKGWTQESIAYNSLVISWPEITRLAAAEFSKSQPTQSSLF